MMVKQILRTFRMFPLSSISVLLLLFGLPGKVESASPLEHLCPIDRNDNRQIKYFVDAHPLFTEVSYIAFSTQTHEGHPVLWMGSDGSNDGISAVDLETGNIIQTYTLDVNSGGDWESMSLGPCTSNANGDVCLYLGNTGNNGAWECVDRSCTKGREEIYVYKLEEPDVNDKGQDTTNLEVVTMTLTYGRSSLPTNRADCETMFVDRTGDDQGGDAGDVYLVTKFPDNEHLERIVKVPVGQHEDKDPGDEFSYNVLDEGRAFGDRLWTGADMSLDGSMIALRGYQRVFFFPRPQSMTVKQALESESCDFESFSDVGGDQRAFEAVTMVGGDIAEASECYEARQCTVAITIHNLEYNEGEDEDEDELDIDFETGCRDDRDWVRTTRSGRKRRCNWVARRPSSRCRARSDDGVRASDGCPDSCGTCR